MAEKSSAMEEQKVLIARDELRAFCMRGLQKAGAAEDHARALADVIVAADYRGHFSHGLNRLEYYMKDLLTSQVASLGQEPEVVKETAATALVDGHNLLGPLVGQFSMNLAIRKAKEAGIGWVSVRGSNHFGIAGWYAIQAQEQGLLGMALTNTSPILVPTRARETTLGTNPISLAAPANHGDSMVLDMATTVVAAGKVQVKRTLNQDIPLGWGVNNKGKMTTEPDTVLGLKTGGLMPLGGPEESSGYKGFGLAMMVEVFCGILSGSNYGPHIRHWTQHHGAADLGQCFVAIDPEAFAPGFRDRMSDLLDHCRNLQPAEGETEVLVPGDPERRHMAMCDVRGGIPFQLKQIQWADDIAKKYDLKPMQRLQV